MYSGCNAITSWLLLNLFKTQPNIRQNECLVLCNTASLTQKRKKNSVLTEHLDHKSSSSPKTDFTEESQSSVN